MGSSSSPSLHHQGTTTGLVTINGLDVGDAGTYRVAVSNAFGWATSAVAVVTIRCVDAASPAPAAPFTNWAGAARAIQDAVDAGNAGDLVLVADGLYATGGKTVSTSVTNRVVLDKPLTVLSLHGPASTIIEGQRDPNTTNGPLSARGAFLEDGAFLKGFMVRGASSGTTYTSDGAGVFCRTVLAGISGCVLSNNIASGNGGGVSRGTVVDSLVVNNTAGADGGGAFGSGMERCLVSGNAARNGGGVASGRAQASRLQNNAALSNGGGAYGSTARNSIIAGNIALSGGGAATTDMVNSTIVGNTTKTATGALMGGNLTNCIVWGNLALAVTSTANGVASLAFSCSAPLPSGPGNISADPQLLDSYHLAVTSPCRGTGTNTASGVDLDGEPWANPPSMGCDEVWEAALTGPLAVGVSAAWPVVAARGVLPLAGSVSGRAARVAWDFGDGTALTNASLLNTTHVWTNPGSYTVTFTAFNTDYPGGVATNLTVQVVPLAAPKLVSGGRTGSTFSLSFPGQAGVTYVVQQTTNLAPPVTWQALTTLTSTGQVMQVLDSTATNAMRFYRTQVP
jgi:hypothetical protein